MTAPGAGDPAGPQAPAEDDPPGEGSESALGGGETGTDDGPAGIPAAMAGQDSGGDAVEPPPAARPDDDSGQIGGSSGGPPAGASPQGQADAPQQSSAASGTGSE